MTEKYKKSSYLEVDPEVGPLGLSGLGSVVGLLCVTTHDAL